MTEIAFVGTSSNVTGCPTIFITERGTLVVQGTTVIDPDALAQIGQHGNGIPAHESCVEIPAALLPFIDVQALQKVAFGDTERLGFTVDDASVDRLRATVRACAPETV